MELQMNKKKSCTDCEDTLVLLLN